MPVRLNSCTGYDRCEQRPDQQCASCSGGSTCEAPVTDSITTSIGPYSFQDIGCGLVHQFDTHSSGPLISIEGMFL